MPLKGQKADPVHVAKRAEGVKRWWASRTEEERKAHAAIGLVNRLKTLRSPKYRAQASVKTKQYQQREDCMTDITIEKQIDLLLNQQYQESNVQFTPLFPWVFVRLCSKEQQRGSLWLPDSSQNKTVHEGIVLSTWQPCTRVQDGHEIALSSELHRGDHVLFNHFAGVPIEGRGSGYRLVKECGYAPDKEGGIMATLSYEELHTKPVNVAIDIVECALPAYMSGTEEGNKKDAIRIVEHLLRMFILVDLNTPSVTISGR
jgi:co-chaperonin GroES (HSP10)